MKASVKTLTGRPSVGSSAAKIGSDVFDEANVLGAVSDVVCIDGRFQCAVVLVTKELADRWIETRNTQNIRSVSHKVVSKYASDMRAGTWNLTHQGLSFSPSGTIDDGQHRLCAVSQSGVPVEMLVFVGMHHVLGIDEGRRRSVRDVFGQMGVDENPRYRAAVSRSAIAIEVGRSEYTHREIHAFYEANREAIDMSAELLSHMPGSPKGLRRVAPFAAVAAASASGVSHALLREFTEVLATGIPADNPGCRSVVRLRDLAIGNHRISLGSAYQESMRAQRCIRAMQTREKLDRLYSPDKPIYRMVVPDELARGEA